MQGQKSVIKGILISSTILSTGLIGANSIAQTLNVSTSGPIEDSATFGGTKFSSGGDLINFTGSTQKVSVNSDATIAGITAGSNGYGTLTLNNSASVLNKIKDVGEVRFDKSGVQLNISGGGPSGPDLNFGKITNNDSDIAGEVIINGKSAGNNRAVQFGESSSPLGMIIDNGVSNNSNYTYTDDVYFREVFSVGKNSDENIAVNLVLDGNTVESKKGSLSVNGGMVIKNNTELSASVGHAQKIAIEDNKKLTLSGYRKFINASINSGNLSSFSIGAGNSGDVELKGEAMISGGLGSQGAINKLNVNSESFNGSMGPVNIGSGGVEFNKNGKLILQSGGTIASNVDNKTGNKGTGSLLVTGNTTIQGKIGPTDSLKNIGVRGSTLTVNDTANVSSMGGSGKISRLGLSGNATVILKNGGTLDSISYFEPRARGSDDEEKAKQLEDSIEQESEKELKEEKEKEEELSSHQLDDAQHTLQRTTGENTTIDLRGATTVKGGVRGINKFIFQNGATYTFKDELGVGGFLMKNGPSTVVAEKSAKIGSDGLIYKDNSTVKFQGKNNLVAGLVANKSGINKKGILKLNNQNMFIGGIGAPGAKLSEVQLNKGAKIFLRSSSIYSDKLKIVGGDNTDTAIYVLGNSTIDSNVGTSSDPIEQVVLEESSSLTVAKGNDVYSPFRTRSPGRGKIVLQGNNDIYQDIGTDKAPLDKVKLPTNEDFYLKQGASIYASVETTENNPGNLLIDGGSAVVKGRIGRISAPFKSVNFQSDYSFTLENESLVHGQITTSGNNTGTLNVNGKVAIFDGIGESGKVLKNVEVKNNGKLMLASKNTAAQDEIYSSIIPESKNGAGLFVYGDKKIYSDLGSSSKPFNEIIVDQSGKLTFAAGSNYYGAISNSGTLRFELNQDIKDYDLVNLGTIELSDGTNLTYKNVRRNVGQIVGTNKSNTVTFEKNASINSSITGVDTVDFQGQVNLGTEANSKGKIEAKTVNFNNKNPINVNGVFTINADSGQTNLGGADINLGTGKLNLINNASATGDLRIKAQVREASKGVSIGRITGGKISGQNSTTLDISVDDSLSFNDGREEILVDNISTSNVKINAPNMGELIQIKPLTRNNQLGFKVRQKSITEVINLGPSIGGGSSGSTSGGGSSTSSGGSSSGEGGSEDNSQKALEETAQAITNSLNKAPEDKTEEDKEWTKNIVTKSAQEIEEGMKNLSPDEDEIGGDSESSNSAKSATSSRMSSVSGAAGGNPLEETGFWVQGFVSDGHRNNVGSKIVKYNNHGAGVTLGADGTLKIGGTLGVSYTWSSTDINFKGNNNSKYITNNTYILYGILPVSSNVELNGQVFTAKSHTLGKNKKTLQGNNVSIADFNTYNTGFEAKLSNTIPFYNNSFNFGQVIGVDYNYSNQEAYEEKGANIEDRKVSASTKHLSNLQLGLNIGSSSFVRHDVKVQSQLFATGILRFTKDKNTNFVELQGLNNINTSETLEYPLSGNFGGMLNIKAKDTLDFNLNVNFTVRERTVSKFASIKVRLNL